MLDKRIYGEERWGGRTDERKPYGLPADDSDDSEEEPEERDNVKAEPEEVGVGCVDLTGFLGVAGGISYLISSSSYPPPPLSPPFHGLSTPPSKHLLLHSPP